MHQVLHPKARPFLRQIRPVVGAHSCSLHHFVYSKTPESLAVLQLWLQRHTVQQHSSNPCHLVEHLKRRKGLMLFSCTVHLCNQNYQAARVYAAYASTAPAGGLAA